MTAVAYIIPKDNRGLQHLKKTAKSTFSYIIPKDNRGLQLDLPT